MNFSFAIVSGSLLGCLFIPEKKNQNYDIINSFFYDYLKFIGVVKITNYITKQINN